MKVKINNRKLARNAKICAWMGFFDENGQYCEARTDNVVLGNLPEETIREVRAGHDITIHVLPKSEIIAFAKNAHDMDKYVEAMGKEDLLNVLMAWSEYDNPEGISLWGTYDFPVGI